MLEVRTATADDCRTFFDWANDPVVRAASFQTNAIAWETHQSWFAGKLTDPDCQMLVLLENGAPVGQARLDGEVISISLARPARGRGLASDFIRRVVVMSGVRRVTAYIKADNLPSIRAFSAAGFSDPEEVEPRDGHPAVSMTWVKE